jgi:hypothetical protein
MAKEHEEASSRWRELAVIVLVAVAVVVVADLGLARLSPPKYVREVQDGMRDYQTEDPTVLVIGSSHARTFGVMNGITRERTAGRVRILDIPLESGKFRSYEWVIEHRVKPLLEEKQGGALKRPSLTHFVLLTAWWDATWYEGDPPNFNLPSRAWTFREFVESVSRDGVNDYSRNYVTSRWLDLWHGSVLTSDRGHGHVVTAARERFLPLSEQARKAQYDFKLGNWRALMDRGATGIGHPEELAAAERILAWAQARGYDTTLMLYPMMPVTVTEAGRKTVQEPFQAMMKDLAARRGVRFIDATFDHNVDDGDFQRDFDHLSPAGHKKFSEWLLDGQMRFLLEPAPSAAGGPTKPAPAASQGGAP